MLTLFFNPHLRIYFLRYFKFFEKEEGKEKKREKNINVWLPLTHHLWGDLACKLRMCSDWDSNQWPLDSQASTQSSEPHQPGLFFFFCISFRERETSIGGLLSYALTRNLTHNLGICPGREWNLQPFRLQEDPLTSWASPDRMNFVFFCSCCFPSISCLWNWSTIYLAIICSSHCCIVFYYMNFYPYCCWQFVSRFGLLQ